MATHVPAPVRALRGRDALGLLLALVAGAVVAASSTLGTVQQAVVVAVLGAGLPTLLVFAARPDLALAAYLFVLPLVLPWPVAAGLNAGEMLTLGIIVFGMVSLWQGRERIAEAVRALGWVLWPLAALALVSVVSLLVNGISEFEEIVSALFKVLAFAIVAVLVHVHSDTPAKARRILVASLMGALGCAIYAVIAYVMEWSYDPLYDWNRASGTFEHWNALGGFMALMSMPTLALTVSSRTTVGRLGYGIAFMLMIAALLLSLTLGSILALGAAGVFALVFLIRIGWRRLLPAALLMIVSIGVVFATNAAVREKITRFDERLMDRLGTYAVGVVMFRDKFWFGFGSEQTLYDQLAFGEADYGLTIFGPSSSVPHNSFLKIAVEKGVFGVLLFTVLIAGALRILFRDRKLQQAAPTGWLYLGIVVGVVAFLVQNMTNDLVLHARIGIVFFAMIALVDRMKPVGAGRLRG